VAEAALLAALRTPAPADTSCANLIPQAQQEQENLLGEVLAVRAHLQSLVDDQATLVLCERAEALLSAENAAFRVIVAVANLNVCHSSAVNNVVLAIESGYQAVRFAQAARQPAVAIHMMALTVIPLIDAGRLHEAEQLIQQAILLGKQSGGSMIPEAGLPMALRANILREWNELEAACSLVNEAVSLCERATSLPSLAFLYRGYAVPVRVHLSCGDLDAACSALQQAEQIGRSMNQSIYLYVHSQFATVDQVRLWLACGELDRATRWVQKLDLVRQHDTPFACERQAVACARVHLATAQPNLALQRLEPAFQGATAGQRWGHVIEIRLLQALAHQRLDEEAQALAALSEAIRLGEPEGYIRSFVDEGPPVADLLRKLRQEQRQAGPTPYLDTLLAAFAKESKASKRLCKQRRPRRLP
jgi:LuxR family maltose regulon positive regulatory protein